MGLFRQRKQRNAFLHIGTAGLQMPGHVALTAINLIAPLCRDPAIELVRDCTVQLVDIDRFQAVLQPIDFGAKTGDRFFMIALLDGEALPERSDDQFVDLVIEPQPRQQGRKFLFEHFLAHEAFRAFPVIAGAMVVDVFGFLDFCRQCTAAMTARNQAGESELPHTAASLGMAYLVPAIQDILRALPQVP